MNSLYMWLVIINIMFTFVPLICISIICYYMIIIIILIYIYIYTISYIIPI